MTMAFRRLLAAAAVLVVAFAASTSAVGAQTPPSTPGSGAWWGSWTKPATDGDTSTDGVFAGDLTTTVGRIDLSLSPTSATHLSPDCPQQPTATQTFDSSTTQPPPSSFEFDEGDAICNGTYDVVATAYPPSTPAKPSPPPFVPTLQLHDIRVAVAPPAPTGVKAASDGQAVVVSWNPVAQPPPPDLQYVVYRSDQTSGPIAPAQTGTTYRDEDAPNPGTYRYTVFATRGSVTTASAPSEPVVLGAAPTPSVSSGSPAANAPGPAPSRSVTVTPGTLPTQLPGTALFDQLGTNDLEPGDPNASISADHTGRAAGTTQHYRSGPPGAGLLKPFAAALVLGVWAMLLLYLSRQGSRAERSGPARHSPARVTPSVIALEDVS